MWQELLNGHRLAGGIILSHEINDFPCRHACGEFNATDRSVDSADQVPGAGFHILLYVGLCDGLKEYRADIALGQRPFEGGKIVEIAGVYQSLL